jgi:very-short-patch-repair endonuclease
LDFDRQRIIGNYIVDFYIKSLGLVIEIDGSSHNDKEEYDEARELFLKDLGLNVYRISDTSIKFNIEKEMLRLENYICEKYG